MDEWEELYVKERYLQQQEENLANENRHIEFVTDDFQDYHYQEQQFFTELSEKFYHNDSVLSNFMNGKLSDVSYKTNRFLSNLEETYEEIQSKRQQISYDIEELSYERQKLSFD
ncbi:hypothetical protein Hs30E_00160 [Lactococcus hodotermopsidis]|uniref:Uncharacterized protein n=1 Tax=Pseudolactococcus hodotermopsidis TaxID=2709157 RepID=A0A6A0B9S8_9LACT|nr:DUF3958 family protein [Lactococcus hodotermopsidis]GFH41465.1 hypothetical protein Hs30E_00160 [Lactococcus hodotermopsidis]